MKYYRMKPFRRDRKETNTRARLKSSARPGKFVPDIPAWSLTAAALMLWVPTHVHADPVVDAAAIWTLQDENAKLSAAKLTDHFYTNGLRLGWVSPTDKVPDVLATMGQALWGDGLQRIGISISQQIYTPCDTRLTLPDPRDWPYAGVLTGNFTVLSDTVTTRDALVISLGVVGPDANGRTVQNSFHSLIGHPVVRGWDAQIPNTPVAEIVEERIGRLPVATVGGIEVDTLPAVAAGVGDLRDYVQIGATLRFGQGLESDFGAPRFRPGPSGEDVFMPVRSFAWYVFAGLDGQAVGYNLLLQSIPFRSGPHVAPVWDIAEGQAGFAVITHGVRITAAYVAQTQEFHGQRGGLAPAWVDLAVDTILESVYDRANSWIVMARATLRLAMTGLMCRCQRRSV